MSRQGLPSTPPTASQQANLRWIVGGVSAVAGGSLAFLLPWRVWNVGGETGLGDFSLLLLGAGVVWQAMPHGRRAQVTAIVSVVAALVLREILWRFHPPTLAVAWGLAFGWLIGYFAVLPAWQLWWRRKLGQRAEPGTMWAEALSLALGGLLMGWLLVGILLR